MRIAFQDFPEWGKIPHAEKELGVRMEKAALAIGAEALYSGNLEEIRKFKPDIVFSLHFFTPKLFDAYTIGCMWNPISAFSEAVAMKGKYPYENVKSYDAFATASPIIANFLDTLCFKSPFRRDMYTLYPSALSSEYEPVSNFNKVAYIGSNWQGDRHRDLFLKSDKIAIFGPRDRWKDIINESHNYYGEVPFGSNYVRKVYRDNGIGLCFHSPNHLKDNLPNMRIFEMAAAGIVIFADKLPFIEEAFGDSVKYIDTSKGTNAIVEQIDYEYNWVLGNQSKAKEMAACANEIFNKNFTLEKLLKDILISYEENTSASFSKKKQASVELIVRTHGGRSKLKESIQSFANQTYKNISITFIYWGDKKEQFEEELRRIVPSRLKYRIIEMRNRTDRSYNLYFGIRSSKAEFIGICDDDDYLFKDHISSLVDILERDKNLAVAYSGVIMDEKSIRGISRELFFFHDFTDFETKSYITSNSYLVRRENIPYQVFDNNISDISTGEDRMFLDLIHFNKGRFAFSERATAVFSRDLVKGDNISNDIEVWKKNESMYKAFLMKSSLEKNYLFYNKEEKIEESIKVPEEVKESSSVAKRYIKIFEKLIPFKFRRFLLQLVKELVESSEKI